MADLMCPHCGWQYDPRKFSAPGDDGRPFALVPSHKWRVWSPARGRFDVECPGTEQHPRNPESDRRPLWKDLPDPDRNVFGAGEVRRG